MKPYKLDALDAVMFWCLVWFLLSAYFPAHASVAITRQFDLVTSTTSQLLASPDPSRRYLFIENKGTHDVLVKLDSAHVADEGVLVEAGGTWEPREAPINSLYIKSKSDSPAVLILEGR